VKKIKKIAGSFLLIIVIILSLPIQGIAENPHSLEKVIIGAVEDDSWMYAKDREKVGDVLKKYYTGPLLEELIGKCWDFVKLPTDWYSIAKILDIKILYNNGKYAIAEIVVRIEDVDTGNNDLISGQFKLSNKSGAWKVYDYTYRWDD
jgi:hypothetical protein